MKVPPTFLPVNALNESICTQVQNFYIKKVKDLFCFMHKKQWDFPAGVIITLLIEPHQAIRAAYLMKKGLDRKKFTNLNPKFLNKEQLKWAPVLLIHGDSSNSGLFAPMIYQISKETPHRPIFTIDLVSPDGVVSAKRHLNQIVDRVKEIVALYPPFSAVPTISLVGHSSGGDVLGPLVKVLMKEKRPLTGTIIKIGSIFTKTEAQEFVHYPHGKILEIVGTKDIFEGDKSYLPNQLVVISGHLGLLFNQTVLERVSTEINSSSRLK